MNIPIIFISTELPLSFLDILVHKVSPELLLFIGQALVILVAFVGAIAAIAIILTNLGLRPKSQAYLEAKSLNDEWIDRKRSLESLFVSKKEWKAKMKSDRETEKERIAEGNAKKRLWVLDFNGDSEASRTECLRNEITAILDVVKSQTASGQDEVLLRLESPGGTVTGYGLAASQLARLRKNGIPLTIAIDEIAASGGYMMAVVANKITASPFAVLGSIGVIGQVPNFHRLLKKYDVDYLEVTAGEHKRPVSIFGQVTDEGIKKFRSQIEDVHALFREHVREYRPNLDLEKTANGDVWHGLDALKLGLIDEISTSDEIIDHARLIENRDVFHLAWKPSRSWRSRLEESASVIVKNAIRRSFADLGSKI
jgi:serine protease SohB